MIKQTYIWPLLAALVITGTVNAQFLNLDLRIEPELRAEVVKPINFGIVISNSGETKIELGEPNMGIFVLTSFRNQRITVDFNTPNALAHTNPEIEDIIDIKLEYSYVVGEDDYRRSQPVQAETVTLIPNSTKNSSRSSDIWESIYFYVYGSLNVDAIPNGEYLGNIVMNIDYE
ncbi:MAG: hypothetical protein AAFW89_07995 [Bacteroidota bacterium]